MTEDETPLYHIIWKRFVKVAGPPPHFNREERLWFEEAWFNRIIIARALFFTIAISCLVFGKGLDVKAILRIIQEELPFYSTHASWYHAFGFVGVALVIRPAISWAARIWLACYHRKCVPAVILGFGLIWWWCANHPGFSTPGWVSAVSIFLGISALNWRHREKDGQVADYLQRGYLVERLFELFQVPNPTVKRIAILGPWGSGKTTVLHLLQQQLKQSTQRKFGAAVVNPWTARTPEDAHNLFAGAFDEALGASNFVSSKLLRSPLFSWLTGIKTVLGFGLTFDLKQVFEGSSSLQENRLIERVNREIRIRNQTCIILVDDMERAEPEIIRKMFPLFSILRRIESCFFVFAIDPDRVAKAFGEKSHNDPETKGYLDKVFDLQVTIPTPRSTDIYEMCSHQVNAQETPKLASALSHISQSLPNNPRKALHFLNDAKNKEILFLNRYDSNDHRFAEFFLIRILELSVPGICATFENEEIKKCRSSASTANLMGAYQSNSKTAEKHFEDAWDLVKKDFPVSPDEELWLKPAYIRILQSGLDIQWALHYHMRLLTPSTGEYAALYKVWIDNAGSMSIEHMLSKAVPEKKFSDIDDSAKGLINREIETFEEFRERTARAESLELAKEHSVSATQIADRLTNHVRYSVEHNLTVELGIFNNPMFEKWLEIMCRHGLSNVASEIRAPLIKAEREFHAALLKALSPGERYQFSRFPVKSIVQIRSLRNGSQECIDHIEFIREESLKMVKLDVISKLRSGELFSRPSQQEYKVGSMTEVFKLPSNWLPVTEFKSQESLANVVDLAPASPLVAHALARICHSLIQSIGHTLEHYNEERSHLIQMMHEHHLYFSHLWSGALHDKQHNTVLLEQRSKLQYILSNLNPEPLNILERAFPVRPTKYDSSSAFTTQPS